MPDGALVDKLLLLLGQLLGAGLDGLVEGEDLGRQLDGALADFLQLVDRMEELLVLGEADILDFGFAIFGVVV